MAAFDSHTSTSILYENNPHLTQQHNYNGNMLHTKADRTWLKANNHNESLKQI